MKIRNILSTIGTTVLFANHYAFGALTITAQSFNTASMALENGTTLTFGVVKMGYYNIAPTQSTFSGYTTASQFENNFVEMVSGGMGIDTYTSLFSVTKNVATGDSSFQGRQIYILVGNNSLLSSSTQIGVYTRSQWTVPTNPTGPTPDPVTFELSDVASSQILWGSFNTGGGAYPIEGVTNQYRLQAVVPEPSTGALMMIGAVGLVALRRLRKV